MSRCFVRTVEKRCKHSVSRICYFLKSTYNKEYGHVDESASGGAESVQIHQTAFGHCFNLGKNGYRFPVEIPRITLNILHWGITLFSKAFV